MMQFLGLWDYFVGVIRKSLVVGTWSVEVEIDSWSHGSLEGWMLRGTRAAEAHLRRFHRRAGTLIRNWTLAIYVICWPRIWLRSVHVLWTWVKFKVEFKDYGFIWRRDFRWCSEGSSNHQRNQHYWRRTACVAPGQQGGLGGKTTPHRACPCKDPNSFKGRTPALKIFYTSDSLCLFSHSKYSLTSTSHQSHHSKGRNEKDIGKNGTAPLWGGKAISEVTLRQQLISHWADSSFSAQKIVQCPVNSPSIKLRCYRQGKGLGTLLYLCPLWFSVLSPLIFSLPCSKQT